MFISKSIKDGAELANLDHDSWPCSPPLTPCLLLLGRYFAVTLLLQLPSTLLSSPSISLFGSYSIALFYFSAFFDLGYSLFGDDDLRTASIALLTK